MCGSDDHSSRPAGNYRRASRCPWQVASALARGRIRLVLRGRCRGHGHASHVAHPRHARHFRARGHEVAIPRLCQRQQTIPQCHDVQHQKEKRGGCRTAEHGWNVGSQLTGVQRGRRQVFFYIVRRLGMEVRQAIPDVRSALSESCECLPRVETLLTRAITGLSALADVRHNAGERLRSRHWPRPGRGIRRKSAPSPETRGRR